MNKGCAALVVAMLVVFACEGVSLASPITFGFSGNVTEIIDNTGVLAGDVVAGDTFVGTYTFDSTLTDSYPDPSGAVGCYASPSSIMHVYVGAFDLWSGTSNSIWVKNGPSGSSFDYLDLGSSNFVSSGLRVSGMGALFTDESATMFANDCLPLLPPPMSKISSTWFQIEGHRGANDQVGFAINGVIHTLTPEPGALLLIAIGGIALTHRCFRR